MSDPINYSPVAKLDHIYKYGFAFRTDIKGTLGQNTRVSENFPLTIGVTAGSY
jgi:hypothetical protein